MKDKTASETELELATQKVEDLRREAATIKLLLAIIPVHGALLGLLKVALIADDVETAGDRRRFFSEVNSALNACGLTSQESRHAAREDLGL